MVAVLLNTPMKKLEIDFGIWVSKIKRHKDLWSQQNYDHHNPIL